MPDINVEEFDVATRKYIAPGVVDNYFKGGPIMAYVKANRFKTFPGGTLIQENFLYQPMVGGSYKRGGKPFDTTRRRTKAATQFQLKTYYVNITEFLEDLEIELVASEAAFDTVKTDFGNAALTLSAILEIAAMQYGQDLSGSGGSDRSGEINGFSESLNDGLVASWDGATFPSYGGQQRAFVNGALTPANSAVGANVAGPPTNRVLEYSYQSAVIGPEHPKLGVTTSLCMAYLDEQWMPLQRAGIDTIEPVIGYPGVKFKQATIVESQYMPGTLGVNDPSIGNYYTAAGETFMWLNPGGEGDEAYFRCWFPKSRKFQFGFTGFKVTANGTQLSGQILVAVNLTVRAPRLMRILHGIRAA